MDFAFYWSHTDAVSKTLFFILIALSLVSSAMGGLVLPIRFRDGVVEDGLNSPRGIWFQ